jgi:hypothetical protein
MSVQDYYAELQKGMIRAGYMRRLMIKFVIFMGGCKLKFMILLTIKNIIMLTVCSSLLCWQRRNCMANSRQD